MIHLINMPFGSIMRAPLALGSIKAQLAAVDLSARVHNFNFAFAKAIGFGQYEMIARFKGVETQVGEWLFAEAAWRRPFGPSVEQFLQLAGEELNTIPNTPDPIPWLIKLREQTVDLFLDYCYEQLVADGVPDVVGFSCMFFQTVAALAFGRLLKERHPAIKLAYGGVCFHGEAGEELFDKVPWIDVVSTGEADDVIVPLFQALARGETPIGLAGIRARDERGNAVVGPPPKLMPTEVLEALPDPDYRDFFADARTFGLMDNTVWLDRASLPFEASRGCWWGQKKHCTFCGLNGDGMAFRAKHPNTVLASLERMTSAYDVRNYQATDNIMAMNYFSTFLPQLAESPLSVRGQKVDLFFEVKANLTRAQIKALADANVCYIQPGIESLSSNVLKAVDKGVTGLQNVFFIKCATEYQLLPIWNLLIRIPGERPEDYAQMEEWLPRLFHLRPPTGGAPRVDCHRYSPYFFREGVYVDNLQPARWYRGIFPEDEMDLGKIAYYFDVTWKHTLEGDAYDRVITLTHEWLMRWRERDVPRLTMHERADGSIDIDDTRRLSGDTVRHHLDRTQAAIYRELDDISTIARIHTRLPADLSTHVSRNDVSDIVDELIQRGLALREGKRILGLALQPIQSTPAATRRIQMRKRTNQSVSPPPRERVSTNASTPTNQPVRLRVLS